jgi:hypothetical protein
MRSWLSALSSDRVPEVALALALGYALVTLLDNLARIPVSVLAQHVGRYPFAEDDETLGLVDLFSEPFLLNFSVGGTVVVYGPVLAEAFALGLVALVAWYVVRQRDRVLRECPPCGSLIPRESTHCAYCGSGVAPGEP